MRVQGKRARFPIAGGSKRQGCVSHSTPEAEIVAADMTLRNYGIPSTVFGRFSLAKASEIPFHDDNQGMIGVARAGRNPRISRHATFITQSWYIVYPSCLYTNIFRRTVLSYSMRFPTRCVLTFIQRPTNAFRTPLAWRRALSSQEL